MYNESHIHLFRNCFHASILWKRILETSHIAKLVNVHIFFNANWEDWIQLNISQSLKWLELFVIALWHIWKNRNKRVFEGAMARSSTQFNHFLSDYNYNNDAFQNQAKNTIKPH